MKMGLVGVDMISVRHAQNRGEFMGLRNRLGGDEIAIRILKGKALPLLVRTNRFQGHARFWNGGNRAASANWRIEAKLRRISFFDDCDLDQTVPGLDERSAVRAGLQSGVFRAHEGGAWCRDANARRTNGYGRNRFR